MARKISVSAAELDALRWIAERSGIYDETKEGAAKMKALGKLLQKAEKAHAPPVTADSGEAVASFGALERILLDIAGKKVVKLGRLTAREYTMVARDIKERGVTEEQMRQVAKWLRAQAWLKGRTTLLTVLKFWGPWYGKAVGERQYGAPPLIGEEPEEPDDGDEESDAEE